MMLRIDVFPAPLLPISRTFFLDIAVAVVVVVVLTEVVVLGEGALIGLRSCSRRSVQGSGKVKMVDGGCGSRQQAAGGSR